MKFIQQKTADGASILVRAAAFPTEDVLKVEGIVDLLIKLVTDGAVVHETDYTCSKSHLFLTLTHPNGVKKSYSIVQEDLDTSGGGTALAIDILLDSFRTL